MNPNDISCKLFRCELCDFTSNRKYNLNRHAITQHLFKDEDDLSVETDYACSKCPKIFTTMRWLKHHELKCKGVDVCTCEFCQTIFSTRFSKYRHYKTCKKKKENDTNALVVKEPSCSIANATTIETQNNTSIETHNNTSIETQNNIQTQNNNVNIIVFNPDDMKFLTDHIDIEKITKMIAQDTRRPEERQEPRAIISSYSRDLLGRPENKCIQKKNLRANYAKVHLGKNKWKSVLDQDVYPSLACNIANTFQNFLYSCTNDVKTNIRLYVRERMIPFLDYMAEQGYCNDEERAHNIMEQFNALVQELRLVTFDLTAENEESLVDKETFPLKE